MTGFPFGAYSQTYVFLFACSNCFVHGTGLWWQVGNEEGNFDNGVEKEIHIADRRFALSVRLFRLEP